MATSNDERRDDDDAPVQAALPHISDALRGLKFGVVSVIVQDGFVVQVERTEKRRLRRPEPK